MIFSCPSCPTRFMVADQLLEPAGRKVKCAKCQHIWFQEPNKDKDKQQGKNRPPVQDIPEGVKPIPQGSGLPVPAGIRNIAWRTVMIVFISLCLLFLAIAIPLRHQIVVLWEPSAIIFETFGFHIPVQGEGIKLDQVEFIEKQKEEQTIIEITGFLTNTTDEYIDIPSLTVLLYKDKKVLNSFSFSPQFKGLSPSESARFTHTETGVVSGSEQAEISLKF